MKMAQETRNADYESMVDKYMRVFGYIEVEIYLWG